MPATRILYEKLRLLILPLEQIDKNLPSKGKIVDLGCGQGVISSYIAKNNKRAIIGIDSNIARLNKTHKKNLEFIRGDITKVNLPKSDGIVISDVLHHLSIENQNQLLKKIYLNLNKSGKLIIKEIDNEEFIRSRLSRFWDFILYPRDMINYRSRSELNAYLKKLGFGVSIKKASRFFPGSTTLYICKK